METIKENQTKERKSFKEVVKDNKKTIMIIGGTIAGATLGGVYLRHLKLDLKKAKAKEDLSLKIIDQLCEKSQITENIIVNSGIIDQAKATIMRKKDRLVGQLNRCINMEQKSDNIMNTIKELKGGIEGFDKMLYNCDELEYLYKSRVIGENLIE